MTRNAQRPTPQRPVRDNYTGAALGNGVAVLLGAGGRVAMTVPELAVALAVERTVVEGVVREDPRFIVLERRYGLPGFQAWAARERAAYAAALCQLDQPPLVLFRDPRYAPGPPAPAGVADLLHRTVVELADARHAPTLAEAAERASMALAEVTRTGGAERSTSLLPDPPTPG